MLADARAARPGVALRPVSKIGDLRCRRLSIGGQPPTDQDGALLAKYAPDLVNLPGAAENAGLPYPDGANDYQPAAVSQYLDGITTVKQVPRGLLGWGNVVYTGFSYVLVVVPFLMAFLAAPTLWIAIVGLVVLINTAIANFVLVPAFRFWGAPRTRDELRDRCDEPDWADQLAMTVLPRGPIVDPKVAWSQYRALVGNDQRPPGQPRQVVYGRVQEDESTGMKVLQYWLFFYFNDWWNKHEADWEVVMVYLDRNDHPRAAACSSHLSGTWRPWVDVEPVGPDKTHPTVYIARGSHALYFGVANGTHYAVLRQPWAVFDFSGQLLLRGSKDSVGSPNQEVANDEYQLVVIPGDAHEFKPGHDRWNEWWWLRFAGRWGARDGVLSPPIQEDGLRWSRPVEWARDHCAADSDTWDQLMDSHVDAQAVTS